jgi:hypothetical protein
MAPRTPRKAVFYGTTSTARRPKREYLWLAKAKRLGKQTPHDGQRTPRIMLISRPNNQLRVLFVPVPKWRPEYEARCTPLELAPVINMDDGGKIMDNIVKVVAL